jgi:glucose-1-phosphate thymidylyltransferase
MTERKIKGVILAGGKGVRLYPLTEVTNKHLLPVGREPMIWHCVRQLVSAEVKDILVITSTSHMGDIVNSLGSGTRFDCEFTYRVQEEAGGIAHALALAEAFAEGQRIVVLLGDNIFERSIRPYVDAFRAQEAGARVLLKKVIDSSRYGVAALDEEQVIEIEEKPAQSKNEYAVVGCYMYDPQVFDLIRQTKPSERGEMEITTVNNLYIRQGQLKYSFVEGAWTDAGTFESLNEANEILNEHDNRIVP